MSGTGPYGTSVTPPQNVGSVMVYIPDNARNPGSQSTIQAWATMKMFLGHVVPQALNDLTDIPLG